MLVLVASDADGSEDVVQNNWAVPDRLNFISTTPRR
jgi:hypothetical protein